MEQLVARQAHNLEVACSSPASATIKRMFYNEHPFFVQSRVSGFWVSGFSRLVCACKSRIKCCKSVHEEPGVSHAPKLGPESFYLGIE